MVRKIIMVGIMAAGLSSTQSFAFDLTKVIGAATTAAKAVTISDAEIKSYASQMAAESDKTNKVVSSNSTYNKRLMKLVNGWQKMDGLNLNFKVYNDKDVNAFAMADGTVRINSGLLDLMNDDEVRFVLGHEIGHVKLGHSKSQLSKSLLTSAALQGASAASGTVGKLADSQLGSLLEQFSNAQFSQADENAADLYGLSVLTTRKVDQKAAVSALEKLAALGDTGGGLMSSHPSSQKRADRIRKQINK